MHNLCKLIWSALVGLFRSRASLQAENLVLRHQFNVLRRKSPRRITSSRDRRAAIRRTLAQVPSVFNALHSRKHDHEVQLYAFDIMALDGEDLRALPLFMRKTNLARLLARRPDGIFVAPFEAGEIGPDLFRAACEMGLEGLVSKRRDRPYRAGRSKHRIKVKNRRHPAVGRVMEAFG
jgi:ATP-dependent DNA ligase